MRGVVERAQQMLQGLGADQFQAWGRPERDGASGSDQGSSRFVCVSCPGLIVSRPPSLGRRPNPLARGMFASVSAASSSNEDFSESDLANLGPTLAIGSRGRKKGTVLTDPEDIAKLKEELSDLTPEERLQLRRLAELRVLNSTKTEEGKPLGDEMVATLKKLEEFEMGMHERTMRDVPRWEKDATMPHWNLRRDAEKMELRGWEVAAMELELMGNGNVFSPAPYVGMALGGQRDFAYAIYANSRRLPAVLGEDWADKPQNEVVINPGFYHDVIRRAPQMELTMMMVPSRDLPVTEAVAKLKPRMEATMEKLEPSEKDLSELSKFLNMFEQKHVQNAPFMDNGSAIKKNSRLLFSVGEDGQTSAEGINPGKLRDQYSTPIGTYFNHKVTYSFFDAMIGEQALDPVCKQSVGKGLTYIANGFSFKLSNNPNQILVDDPNAPAEQHLKGLEEWRCIQEELPATRRIFTFLGASSTPTLLTGVQDRVRRRDRRRRKLAQQQAQQAATA